MKVGSYIVIYSAISLENVDRKRGWKTYVDGKQRASHVKKKTIKKENGFFTLHAIIGRPVVAIQAGCGDSELRASPGY